MPDRRYTEDEVAAIFERAAEAQQSARKQLTAGDSDGLTLRELQDIGREVGIAPELIASAARAVGAHTSVTTRRILGLPIGVGRTVDIDRKLSEADWERLVVDLRDTFDAKGRIRVDGNFRQWTNGNLQALLEPTATGHRLRLRTFKGDSMQYMAGGAALLIGGVSAVAGKLFAGGTTASTFAGLTFILVTGLAMITFGAARLPSWARLRRKQMDDVAARLASATGSEMPRAHDVYGERSRP